MQCQILHENKVMERPEVRNGGGKNDPVGSEHVLTNAKVHIT